ncbi:MAG: endonuclease/exonuclease/phosphatase family protein [Kofleriaceae bacterium]
MTALRAMSYNIHHARGVDGRVDLARIAAVIRSFDPDVVGIQEVDVGRARSGAIDQATELADQLGMTASFAPCIEDGCERYGIATLTRLAVVETRQVMLPRGVHRRSEPRCALVTRLAWPGPNDRLAVINTHLSTVFAERPAQLAALADASAADQVVLLGDFNCTPWSRPFRALRGNDLRSATAGARSWPSRLPFAPIDHILVRGALAVVRAGAWRSGGARTASDHLPVIAELAHTGAA